MLNTRMRLLICLLTVFVLSGSGNIIVQAETLSNLVRLSYLTLQAPSGVALDSNETIYVVESAYKRLAVIDNSGSRIAEIRGFNQPKCVAVDGGGRVYVSDAGLRSVTVFGPDLALQGKLGAGDGEFLKPLGIAVSAAGDVYVVDSGRNQVRVYGPDRQIKRQFGLLGSAAGQLRNPLSIAVDRGTNEVVVVDLPMVQGQYGLYEGSRVQVFDATGKYLRGFGQNGVGEGKLAKAMALATDHNGKIYVSDTYQNIVEVFSRTGSYIETVYDATANMRTPVGLAIGGISGRLFVSSISLSRLDIFGQPIQHIVNAECSAGGTITPSGSRSVIHGAAISFKITALAGYHISGVYVDGVNVGAVTEYQLPIVVADHTVRAEFDLEEHTVLVESSGGGVVTPSGSIEVLHQEDLILAITPDPGFRVADVVVDGVSAGALESYTLSNVTTDHTVQVVFESLTYVITATAGEHGSISPSGAVDVVDGSDATFSFTPQSGYRIAGVTVDGRQMGSLASYTFSNISAGHELNVTFSRITYQISASSSVGGYIYPAGVITVEEGSGQVFTFVPELGYRLSGVLVDGLPVMADSLYLFGAIAGPHSIRVEYARIHYNIDIVSEGKGSAWPAGSIEVAYGDSLTVELKPDVGYHVAGVQVDGLAIDPCAVYTFSDIRANHALDVQFVKNNDPPVALAGPDQVLNAAIQTITLNGAHSFDPDGIIRTFLWEQTAGVPVALPDPTSANISFPAPNPGDDGTSLEFRLTVIDDQGVSAQDSCLVNLVRNYFPPTADAGSNQRVKGGDTVILDGSGSVDEDGFIDNFLWEQISGEAVEFAEAEAAITSFIAPDDVTASLTFRLVVTDNTDLKAASECRVNVSAEDLSFVAEAGSDRLVREGETVELRGLVSTNANNSVLSYLWKQTQGTPPVSLNNHTTANASFIAPVVDYNSGVEHVYQLEVTDEAGLVATDNVIVRIYKTSGRKKDIGPDNHKSGGNWITVTIELSQDSPYQLIDFETLALTRINSRNISPPIVRTGPVTINDSNRDGIPELRMKFERQQLAGLLRPGFSLLTLSGRLTDGTEFQKEFRIDLIE
ncbi:MAG: hypothetical protein A2511_03300 [Deltaproteobacteria bacterium RIFOXYD12_FULL_50_9]|nr:MAG: hypothetical protein A2511_03300 [Deltaproteobacteria bacterium RIFOXYD12_FULL_50_9]